MRGKTIAIVCIATSGVLGYQVYSDSLSGYHIGNSLTFDCKLTTMPPSVEAAYDSFNQGYHIACSRSLTHIVSDPELNCSVTSPEPYGTWTNALSTFDWNYVTLQGYREGATATGNSELAATITLIHEALSEGKNTNCTFYLYFPWPQTNPAMSYSEQINLPFTNGNDSVLLSKEFTDFWYTGVTQEFGNLDVRLIPTGIVLEEMDKKIREIPIGQFDGVYDLYRDKDHMGWFDGRYIAHATMLASILQIHPDQISFKQDFIDAIETELGEEIAHALISLSNEVIWSVLTRDLRTYITDIPTVSIRTNAISGLEISFIGQLLESANLSTWNPVEENLHSPFRLDQTNNALFFKSIMTE